MHLVTQKGYSRLFHELDDFKGTTGNVLSDAMDAARGGRFPGGFPVEHYPEGAWYSYNDVTCTYGCQKTEYLCVSPQQTRFTSPTSHVSHASRLPHLPHLTSFHVSFSLPAAGTGCSHPISGAKAMARVAPGTSRSIMNGSSQPGSYCCTVMATATAPISWAWRCWCDKRASFWSHFQIENTIDLPRQARDKHNREHSKKRPVFHITGGSKILTASAQMCESKITEFNAVACSNAACIVCSRFLSTIAFYRFKFKLSTHHI